MDRNNIIGLALIFIITMLYLKFVAPSPEEIKEQERIQDSILLAESKRMPEEASLPTEMDNKSDTAEQINLTSQNVPQSDSANNQLLVAKYGVFASSISDEINTHYLENEKLKIEFSSKGGRITNVELKGYKKIIEDSLHERISSQLRLMEDEKNKFEYLIPYAQTASGMLNTGDLNFQAELSNNTINFKAIGSGGQVISQTYSISPGSYTIDYLVDMQGINNLVPPNTTSIDLHWVEYLDKIELNSTFEKTYSTTYFKVNDENRDYLSANSDDEEIMEQPVIWVSHSNQFFNSSLIPSTPFPKVNLKSTVLEDESEDLKLLVSDFSLPMTSNKALNFPMQIYIGPNEFELLRKFDNNLEDVVDYGWSFFGTINRWVIRPLFQFLNGFIGSLGLSIILLTLIVKLLLYPLTYKMLHSQAKMSALKPEISKMKERLKDDSQKQQMETMKLYREYGVNPLGGCMPMVLQMPIWFALYRFFPAAIDFRQESFLWATDLSSYDVFTYLPFEIPFVGAHISLFTVLWAITTLIYTYYNTKMMDMSANPAMKYMQYIMPVMFLGFFNNYASGLTAYLFFSNLINIAQTLVTKNLIFSDEKIRQELNLNKAKPKKKKSGFQQRLEEAMKEQQRIKENKKKK